MITKCLGCGGVDFYINETTIHEAELCDDGELDVHSDDSGGIDIIFCKTCGKEYAEKDFTLINFG